MAGVDDDHKIAALTGRLILDSHLAWTPEFEIVFADGGHGRGSAPRGETLSIFEAPGVDVGSDVFAEAAAGLVGRTFSQATFDQAAGLLAPRWGGQTTLALSIAFHLAARSGPSSGTHRRSSRPPRLLLNVLNGGLHAYTNPVTSDVHEFMLYARSDDLRVVVDAYVGLLDIIRSRLRPIPTVEVGGNRVHALGDSPNEAALGLLRDILRSEGLESLFGIALDASAGDWWTGDGYALPVSGRRFGPGELGAWWLRMIEAYDIELLEDPFGELDRAAWQDLHTRRPASCLVLGDNYTSTDPARLTTEGRAADIDGVLVKPNQNGTVSGTLAFAAAARAAGLIVVASHRSVETESTMLIELADEMGADGLKIGPFRDFTAVIKVNELLRGPGGPWPA